jgi:hypothetical protein
MTLNLEYTGSEGPIFLTVYDGKKKDVIALFEVDPAVNPVFTIDRSGGTRNWNPVSQVWLNPEKKDNDALIHLAKKTA